MINYNEMAAEIYTQNEAIGWWDDPNRCIFQTLQLVSTEIAEATEGERKNLMDDHLPHRKMGEVELADALIRVLDIGGRYGWEFDTTVAPFKVFSDPDLSIADKPCNYHYSQLVVAIVTTAESQGYDIEGAMAEKLEYNKNRADHKQENRAKQGGKAF